jgi:selenocysteine-specific elongation factor
MHIIGTAGHVDHGKSSLVLALTGHNPDRLIEERERGMTLDLGFAPLRFPDGVEAGIVDVPGHERFLHNMLAGAAGMELLLLVIAAPDGPKRQTFEHLQILNFLNVSRAIVVLTKADLLSFEELRIAEEIARAACEGTIAADAPVVAVSSVTGAGVDALKTIIHDTLATLPPRRLNAPAFLPVDRVFALPGHGTIVTGTLMQGTIAAGDTLALQPSGLAARVKSLQIFGTKVDAATGGSRVAVNLPGIDVDQIARGESLVAAREFKPTRDLDIEFTPFAAATGLLRKRLPVRVHIGSAEIPGQLRFDDGLPNDTAAARARLSLWRPAVAYPGMRLIVRRMSPKDLLGGARVVAHGSTEVASDRRDPAFEDAPESALDVRQALEASGFMPLDAAQLSARVNAKLAVVDAALAWLIENGHAVKLQKPVAFLSRVASDGALRSLQRSLTDLHEQTPWRLGASTAEIATALAIPEPLAARLLALWEDDGLVVARSRFWQLPGFEPRLKRAQAQFFERILAAKDAADLVPHPFEEVSRAVAREDKSVAEAFESLLAIGAFVRVGEDLYRRAQYERAQAVVRGLLEREGQATMAQIRDVLGTSRKHALPLMEHFDSSGLTIRVGDLRRLRKS